MQFSRTIINAPNGGSTAGTDLNNSAVVVGIYNEPAAKAFAWSRSTGFVDLEGVATAEFSLAHAINECGQVVGEIDNLAVRWNTFDEVEYLGTLGGPGSEATNINDRGDVVGVSQVGLAGRATPFLWTEKRGMRRIVECEGSVGAARAINNTREVTGFCDDAMDQSRAFFWSSRTGRIDLNVPEFQNSQPFGINDRGEIVGVAFVGGQKPERVAFKWTPRKQRLVLLRDLGDDFSIARDINRAGWIVGDAVNQGGTRRAVIWVSDKLGFAVDPGLGTMSFASALNDRGAVLGNVNFANPSDHRAVLWKPSRIVSQILSKRGVQHCLRPTP